ncbi:AAA family ATPase [candidate division TA06 bacterium]|uniref:AAA family ATPase n=1 Tax=candidate division TA06 bacterium TaxID=2250710 RepID=A0A933MK35_UNCT6|nr:AAA family ATPase [candidate division TA06 bacterium]
MNVFIGKPNTGKTNILEAIGIIGFPYGDIREFVRFEHFPNLFYDLNLDEGIVISLNKHVFTIEFDKGSFEFKLRDNAKGTPNALYNEDRGLVYNYRGDYEKLTGASQQSSQPPPFKYYLFAPKPKPTKIDYDSLYPPYGENLLFLLQTRKNLRKIAADIFSDYGFRVLLKPTEQKIEIQKEIDDIAISLPYIVVSDTLRRVLFHIAAIESNKNAVIAFDEPEAFAFPYYTKYIAERIAFDESNQYFIATHNPYFLLSILEKTPQKDINIFITYFKDYQTKLKCLSADEMKKVLDLDASIFFNLDQFVEE